MAFIRKLPDVPERLEHLKGGAGHLERYAILSPEEMLGAGTVCARMVLQPGSRVTAKVISCATTATRRWSFWPSCSISPRRHKETPSPWWGRRFL